MILVCGGLADTVTELVCARLEGCGYLYRLLNLGTYPDGYRVAWHWDGPVPVGYVATAYWHLDLADVRSVYVRFLGPEGRVPAADLTPDLALPAYAEYDAGWMALLESLPCLVVNRLWEGMSNHSKPYQAQLIRDCGLRIPPTLVTNDPEEALRFLEEWNGEVVYKSLSGVRSIVRQIGPEQRARMPLLQHGPAQFQAFVPGDNIRVHTVGDDLFATRVRSEAVDYRYAGRDGQTVEMEPATLPVFLQDACLRLAHKLGLALAGIDLKETPEGDYYCFEINPCPGFLYYEQHTGQPISTALADLLHHGSPAHVVGPAVGGTQS